MPWVYIDDRFPEHPKTEEAVEIGGDAVIALFVVGLCYVNRNHTGGTIPKTRVPKLVHTRAHAKLTAALVQAGLWEDKGDCWLIHDYEQWNRSAVARAKGQKAARARWDKEPPRPPADAPEEAPDAPDTPDGACMSNAQADAQALPTRRRVGEWVQGNLAKPEEGSRPQLRALPSGQPVGSITSEEAFQRFWEAYPKRVGESDARRAFVETIPPPYELTLDRLLARLAEWGPYFASLDHPDYVPKAADWLRDKRWLSAAPPPRPSKGPGATSLNAIARTRRGTA